MSIAVTVFVFLVISILLGLLCEFIKDRFGAVVLLLLILLGIIFLPQMFSFAILFVRGLYR